MKGGRLASMGRGGGAGGGRAHGGYPHAARADRTVRSKQLPPVFERSAEPEKPEKVRQFIISRSTAISLLRTRQRLQAERLQAEPGQAALQTTPVVAPAPVDFHKRQMDFTFDLTAPALKDNVSYEVFLSHHGNMEKLAYNPLRFSSVDGSVFTLSEAMETAERDRDMADDSEDVAQSRPNAYDRQEEEDEANDDEGMSPEEAALKRHIREGKILEKYGKESECIGSLLYMSNLKMHRTKGYSTTTDFSKEFARAAGVKEGHVTLDLFLGLGYASHEALNMGAERVVAFEKYTAVQSLVRRNPWSMNLDDPSLAHRFTLQTLDVQRDKSVPLFKFFADYKRKGILPSLFNSVILDPPKKKVMLYIYSKYFLEHLAEWTKKDGVVAAYMPPGGLSPKFEQCREELVQTFQDTRKFEFIDCWDPAKMIWRFRRR